MIRTSAIRIVVLVVVLSSPVSAAPPGALPPGAVRRLGTVRQFASGQLGLAAYSADGTRLVACAGEYTMHVWDGPAVKAPHTLLRPGDHVITRAALAPDGKTLALGTADSVVLLCSPETGAVRRSLVAARRAVQEIAFAPDSKRFATFGSDAVLRVWGDGQEPIWSETFAEARPLCLAFAGDQLLAGCDDGNVRIWDSAKGKSLPRLATGRSVRALAVTADGRIAFAEGADHVLLAWEVAGGPMVRALQGHTAAVVALACSADGRLLASAGLDGGVRLWDVETGEVLDRLYGEDRTAVALALAPDGRTLVVATPDSCIDQWNLATIEQAPLLNGHREEVEALAFVADGREVHTWSASEALRWQAATGKALGASTGHKPPREKLVTSPCGKYRVLVDPEASVFPVLVSTETGKEIALAGALRSVRGAAFSLDDKILAVAGSDGNVTLWETYTGEVLAEFKVHDARASCIAFAPDGRTFATGGGDASVVIWSLTACGPPLTERWRDPDPDDLEAIWKAFLGETGEDAFAAMRALMAAPKKAVPFLRSKLPPPLDLLRIKLFVAQLDSDDFETREKASQELERLGRDAEQALRDAQAGKASAEMRRRIKELLANLKGDDAPRVRCWLRAVFVLEQIGTPEAREVLKLLAEGDRVAKAAEDARAALKRK
jgi:WD40 repeat protein